MKKHSYITGALSTLLLGASALSAQPCSPNWNNSCCDWSFCDGKVSVGADWLYWQTEQSNMEFFYVNDTVGTTDAFVSNDYSAIDLNRNFESGFRVNVGYELPSNGWQFNVVYTNMPAHATASSGTLESTQSIFASSLLPSDSTTVPTVALSPTAVRAKWDTNINNIDADVGYTLAFGECFRLRPHVGFRATWLDQKYSYNLDNEAAQTATQFTTAGKLSEKLNGYGVEGGLFANWNIGCGFSLVGHVGGSLLYSKITVTQTKTVGNVALATNVAFLGKSDTFRIGTPSLDYFVGLEYLSNFCETDLCAYLGWEQHVLFDVNQLFDYASGNLYTQGLTLGLNASF